jgi:ATP-binding cassette subfamily F protein uup
MSQALLSIENLSKSYSDKLLFENLNFGINEGQKIALVAHNGVGKSTLLNIITGKDIPDDGQVILKEGLKISYLTQDPQFDNKALVKDVLFHLDNLYVNIIRNYHNSLEKYQKDPSDKNQKLLDEATRQMDHREAWDYENRMTEVLQKFEISNLNQVVGELSGGQRKKLALASIIIDEADLIILDEPTNHLDIKTIEWLENHISNSKLSLLIVTHDRYFLDEVCDIIIEIDQHSCFIYQGNFSYFLEKKAEREALDALEIDKAKNLYRKELDWMRRQPKARTTKSKARIDSFYNLEKIAQKRLEVKKLDFHVKMSRQGRKILEIENLHKSFGETLITKGFEYIFKRGERIGLVGDNGSGKSTFLNMLTGKVKPDQGKVIIGETTRFGYYTQKGLETKEDLTVIEIVKEVAEVVEMGDKSFGAAQFLFFFGFSYSLQQSQYKYLSGGERRKLYLVLTLMQNPNFLILDEPTNDLDIFTLNKLEEFLLSFQGCLIIVSHDRYFLDKLSDHLFLFHGNGEIKDFVGNYSDYRELKALKEAQIKKEKREEKKKEESKTIKNKPSNKPTYKETKEFEKLEKEMPKLEEQKEVILNKMNSGSLDTDEFNECSKEYQELSDSLDEMEMRWLELSEKIV